MKKMHRLILILLPLAFILSCHNEPEGSNPLVTRDYEKADKFLPLALGSFWEYDILDSTDLGIETKKRKELVDSCCYYIGLYDIPTGQYLGWKWRDFSWEIMYANGGAKFFTTEYIDDNKGTWNRLDSSFSQNTVIVDVASGLYNVETPYGSFKCIKTRTQLIAPDSRFSVVITRYFGKDIGLVKHVQSEWQDYGKRSGYISRTVISTLVNAELH